MDNKKSLIDLAGYPCAKIEWDERLRKDVPSRPAVNCNHTACKYCPWNPDVAAKRARLPLTLCPDGLRRKLIPTELRPVRFSAETEAGTDD